MLLKVEAGIDDFQRLILLDLNFEAFRVLGDVIGEEKTREVFKPHMINSATALLLNSQKHLGTAITDLRSMVDIICFIGQAVWRASPGERFSIADGIVWWSPDGCYLAGAPVCLRRMVCEDAGMDFFMSKQEFGMLGSCQDRGDSECANIYYEGKEPPATWKEDIGRGTPITPAEFDEEKVRQFGILALGELWLFPTQALMEWKGQEAIPKLKEAMRPLGRKWGKELSRVTGMLGNDMGAVFSVIDTYNSIMGQEGRTIYSSSDRHETDITICPFSVAPAEMGAACGDAIGAQCEAFNNGLCEAVSPDFEVRFTTKMCTDGQCCHRVIRKKLSARVVTD
jgi:hypothetical protein